MRTQSPSRQSWAVQSDVTVYFETARERRLNDLALAMVIPWLSDWPCYWLNEDNVEQRMDQILEATKEEKLPWQL